MQLSVDTHYLYTVYYESFLLVLFNIIKNVRLMALLIDILVIQQMVTAIFHYFGVFYSLKNE